MKTSELSTSLARRPDGPGAPPRRWRDFVVDGVSLGELVDAKDLVSVFADGDEATATTAHRQLLKGAKWDRSRSLATQSEDRGGRTLLYVCAQCADLACGAIGARIYTDGQHYYWVDFAYENGYEPPHRIEAVGPFRFEAKAYARTLKKARALP
ncbi:MAG: hypothetical protein RIT81_37680 [Deltaproteobacteria bacterium]